MSLEPRPVGLCAEAGACSQKPHMKLSALSPFTMVSAALAPLCGRVLESARWSPQENLPGVWLGLIPWTLWIGRWRAAALTQKRGHCSGCLGSPVISDPSLLLPPPSLRLAHFQGSARAPAVGLLSPGRREAGVTVRVLSWLLTLM